MSAAGAAGVTRLQERHTRRDYTAPEEVDRTLQTNRIRENDVNEM